MPTSKFFRVAVAGATVDGRTIEPQWLTQMAANFNPATYGARVWLEHLRGIMPDGSFKALGDVVALKTQEDVVGGQKKIALYAQINPTPDLEAMVKARQKIYTSIEVTPKFSDTGEAYLTGLAVTDSPASIGTEQLQFSRRQTEKVLGGQEREGALFSEPIEADIELEGEAQPGKFSAALQGIREKLAKFSGRHDAHDQTLTETLSAVGDLADNLTDLAAEHDKTAAAVVKLTTENADLAKRLADLEAKFQILDTTDADPGHRPPAAGGAGVALTDC